MAVVLPVGYAQAALHFSCIGRAGDIVTTIGYIAVSGHDASEDAELIYDAWRDTTGPFNAASMGQSWAFEGVTVSVGPGPDYVVGQHMEHLQGTQTMQSLPINCAFLVRKNTARGGRKGRGRMYLPPTRGGEDQVNAIGVLDSNLVIGLQTGCTNALELMRDSGIVPCLPHEDGTTPDIITSLSVQTLLATQRRRMR